MSMGHSVPPGRPLNYTRTRCRAVKGAVVGRQALVTPGDRCLPRRSKAYRRAETLT